jgi:hypothetical protein
MSEQDTGLRHAVASDVTRDDFDENLTFGEAGSSSVPSGGCVKLLHPGLRHAVASDVTRDDFDMSPAEAGYGPDDFE